MLIDEEKKAINRYLELKRCKNWIESIESSFFFEFAETVITAYEKEKEKNKNLNRYFENQKDNFVHKDKIKAKIEEVSNGTYDAKIVLQSLLEKE